MSGDEVRAERTQGASWGKFFALLAVPALEGIARAVWQGNRLVPPCQVLPGAVPDALFILQMVFLFALVPVFCWLMGMARRDVVVTIAWSGVLCVVSIGIAELVIRFVALCV